MLDSRDVALGSTAATTALLQYEIDTHLTDLVQQIGAGARSHAPTGPAPPVSRSLERRFPELLKPSNYRRRESLYLATDQSAVPTLRAELAARRAHRISLRVARRRRAARRLWLPAAGRDPVGARRRDRSGAFHAGLDGGRRTSRRAAVCADAGRRDHRTGCRVCVSPPSAAIPSMPAHVIVAAGFESLDFLPRKVADINNTYALVTEPLADPRRASTLPHDLGERAPLSICARHARRTAAPGWRRCAVQESRGARCAVAAPGAAARASYRELFGEDLPPIAYAWGGSFAATEMDCRS